MISLTDCCPGSELFFLERSKLKFPTWSSITPEMEEDFVAGALNALKLEDMHENQCFKSPAKEFSGTVTKQL